MSGGLMGGSRTTEVKIPKWLQNEAKRNIDIARDVAAQGFVPYYGPDVAAFSPMQNAAFDNTNAAASAFGMAGAQGNGMPAPQTFAGGVQGYSSAPLFQQSLDTLQARRPGQYDAMMGMFIDPVTGAPPAYPFGGARTPNASNPLMERGGNQFGYSNEGGGVDYDPGANGQNSPYSGFGDMFDGGGPGASGGQFQGGGLLSSVANIVTGRR